MIGFLKKIGMGIAYIFVLPIYIVALALYGVVGLFLLLILFIKSIYLFFTGRSLDDDLPEDKEAKEILAKKESVPSTPQTTFVSSTTPSFYFETVSSSVVSTTSEEPTKEETSAPQSVEEACFEENENSNIVQSPLEENVETTPEDTPEEIIEKYKPMTNTENTKTFFDTKELFIGDKEKLDD